MFIKLDTVLLLESTSVILISMCILQFHDKEGRTPLILACTRGDLFEMALTLLNLGANIKAYRPGRLSTYGSHTLKVF